MELWNIHKDRTVRKNGKWKTEGRKENNRVKRGKLAGKEYRQKGW